MSNRSSITRATVSTAILLALAVAAPGSAVSRRAFLTSSSGGGDLGAWPEAGDATGLAAGDAICRNLAAGAGLPNAASYRAWLSTGGTDAFCHVQGLTGKKSTQCGGAGGTAFGPWYQANGATAFTGTLAELTGPERVIYRGILWDENLDLVPEGEVVLTGTSPSGEGTGNDCDGWTDDSSGEWNTFGFSRATAEIWTDDTITECDLPDGRLLCLEPGASTPFAPFWSPGALAFVTSATGSSVLGDWPQAGSSLGVAAGDAICRNLAAAARLPAPDSFVAWLSSSVSDAKDRLVTNGPFKRVDGFTIANSLADLVDGQVSVSLHVDETGRYLEDADDYVWTGTLADGTAATDYCEDWESSDPSGVVGAIGHVARSYVAWSGYQSQWCSAEHNRLYCFSNVVTLFWDGFETAYGLDRWSDSVDAP